MLLSAITTVALYDSLPLLFIPFVIFCLSLLRQHVKTLGTHQKFQLESPPDRLPPKYRTFIPYFGVLVPFLSNTPSFLQRVTTSAGRLTSVRVTALPFVDVFLFQDHVDVKEIWKQSRLLCDGRIHRWCCKNLFGMPESFLAKYAADNSGPFAKPFPGSNVPPEKRIHRMMNMGNHNALAGPGFFPTMRRFKVALMKSFQMQDALFEQWTEVEDLHRLVHSTVGRSLIQAIFGPGLLEINPGIMNDLYELNQQLPWLMRGVPKFLMPRPYAVRNRLQQDFKRWYAYARENFDVSSIYSDGDGDPFWGSNWMRERQKVLQTLQDDDAMAAGDMGVAWASIENVVSAITMALVHVYRSPSLRLKIQDEVTKAFGALPVADIDLKELSKLPLLSSIYAETLRLHAKSFTLISSSLQDIPIGRYKLPKDDIGLINAHVAHMDETFWNTQNGLHPVNSFWPERFLIDPNDPTSGPARSPPTFDNEMESTTDTSYFSTKGLEAAWIPYGGGHLVCPGRFLAKVAMTFLCTLMIERYDMEVLVDNIKFSKGLFGFGVEGPAHAIPIRIKKRDAPLQPTA